jgi:putative PIN family toxin of toxin-antitoxin system
MRWVLDTNVVVSALLWSGTARRLIMFARLEGVRLFSSMALLAELSDVLSRRKFENKIAASLLSVDEIVALYAEYVFVVRPRVMPRIASDPDDDIVIGTALAASAELVVTGDRALLSVGEYERVRIVSVAEALRSVGGFIDRE